MRIVGGMFRGRRLAGPPSLAVRPTSDRLRESLFNILTHQDVLDGVRVLDLFAGTGALGLEALSRGASFALFVEEAVAARGVIRENVEALGVMGTTSVFRRDATQLGQARVEPFSLVFCDPPYRQGLGEMAIKSAMAGGWLALDALVIVEEAQDAVFDVPDGFELVDHRDMGESQLLFLRLSATK